MNGPRRTSGEPPELRRPCTERKHGAPASEIEVRSNVMRKGCATSSSRLAARNLTVRWKGLKLVARMQITPYDLHVGSFPASLGLLSGTYAKSPHHTPV